MPTTDKAPADLRQLVAQVVEDYHPDLVEAGVTIKVEVAIPTERDMNTKEAPFLKDKAGHPARGKVQLNSVKLRKWGIEDVVLTLCQESFKGMTEDEQRATVDHYLTMLELVRDDHDQVETDDAMRPKLRLRLPDVAVSGFASVIRRHGIAAIEAQQIRDVVAEYKQAYFDWCDDQAPQDPMPDIRDAVA